MRSEPVSIKVRLKVKTPTAIGTGESYTLFSYAVKERELLVINFKKLIEKLKSTGRLGEFKELLKRFTPFDVVKLQNFYSRVVGRDEAIAVLKLEPEVAEYFKGKFARLAELLRGRNFKEYFEELGAAEVREAFKNPLTGKAYIPGSSLKGAIRTSLLNYLIKKGKIDKEKFIGELQRAFNQVGLHWPGVYSREELPTNFGELEKALKRIFNEIDSHLLCDFLTAVDSSDFGRDLMRFVKVSDFSPTGEVSTSVGRLRRVSRKGKENAFGFVEFVEPGALFEGTITFYPEFIEKYAECPLKVNPQLVVKALRSEYSKVLRWERDFLGKSPLPFTKEEVKLYQRENSPLAPIKLGFGAGALSKTFSDAPELRVIGNRHTGIRPEPTEISVMRGRPMGWCLLEVC